MNETDFRILSTLSTNPGRHLSVRGLTTAVRARHGIAHYANTYRAARRLQREGILRFARAGSSQLVSLNFESPLTTDSLAEMELLKRRMLAKRLKSLRRLLVSLSEGPAFGPIALIDLERNAKLNRAEILITLPSAIPAEGGPDRIRQQLNALEKKLNLRIDPLVLSQEEFRTLLSARDANPLKEMLSKQIVVLGPDLFWSQIRASWAQGIEIRFDETETDPAHLTEGQILHNLSRFGYEEFGPRLIEAQNVGMETLTIALLLRQDPRYAAAAAVVLAKNAANYSLLLFLSKKHGMEAKMLGLLETVDRHKPEKSRQGAIQTLRGAGVAPAAVDEGHVARTLRTYDAL